MKIMVVDDSSTVRSILRKELEAAGHSVREAEDGRQALGLFERGRPDLVTLDVEMPGLDGFETCAELRALERTLGYSPPTPIVFITTQDSVDNRNRGFELGAADFLRKPTPPGALVARVEHILVAATPLKGLTAMVVEDSAAARFVLASALRQEGMVVLEAESGEAALGLARERGDQLGLLLVDYNLPQMNGAELCQQVRQVPGLARVPIIAMSAFKEKQYLLDMFDVGATDFLYKPFAKEELLARIMTHRDNHRLHRRLERQVRSLERLNRVKDSFLAAASHDLRAPLTSILGNAEILSASPRLDDEDRESVRGIRSSGEGLLALIADLLDLVQIETEEQPLRLAPVPLGELVDAVVAELKPVAEAKGVALEAGDETTGGSQQAMGEAAAVRRVLTNLVSNAIKFTPAEGRVAVVLESDPGGDLAVRVQDTGVGVPREQVGRLFERFTPAARTGTAGERSTGLGLAISQELVERLLGRITVESVEGEGSVFRVILPVSRS